MSGRRFEGLGVRGSGGSRRRGALVVTALAALVVAAAPAPMRSQAGRAASIAGVQFSRAVAPFEVRRADGTPHALPFLGGLDVPRPQFVDIDADGDDDLFVQEYSNALWFFENGGSAAAPRYEWRTDRYQNLEIGEWYRFIDLNGDGLLDLLTEQPVSHIRHYRNTGTKSAATLTYVGELRDGAGEPMFMDRQNIPAIADLDCDGRLDMLVGRVEGVVDRYEAPAPNAEQFSLVAERYEGIEIIGGVGGGGSGSGPAAWTGHESGPFAPARPTRRHGANALALADFDGDGDQDLYWGDFFEPAVLLIENIGRTCSSPSFQVDPIRLPFATDTVTSGYNAPAPVDADRDGDMDFFLGVIGGAFNPVRTSEDNFFYWERTAADKFELRTKRYLDGIDLGSDAVPALADIDADGDLDLIVGNKIDATSGGRAPLYVFRNEGTASAPRFRQTERLALGDAYNLAPALADLDADGDLDIVLGTWNQDVLYLRNEGTPREPRWVEDPAMAIRPPRVSHATPALGDLDGDGDLDLILGQANGAFVFYRNTGTRSAPAFTLVTERMDDIKVGRRSTPALVDVDGDGLVDLVSGHEDAGPLAVYRNVGTKTAPRFVEGEPLPFPVPTSSAPAFADIDGDGVLDLFVGTTSGGLRLYKGRGTGQLSTDRGHLVPGVGLLTRPTPGTK